MGKQFIRRTCRYAAILVSPALAIIWTAWNRAFARGEKVLVLIGMGGARDLIHRLREAGHHIVVVEASPRSLNWRLVHEAYFLDTFDLGNTAKIVDIARKRNLRVALAQSNEWLVPQVAAVNKALGNVAVSDLAVQCSLSKGTMHRVLANAGVQVVPNAVIADEAEIERHGIPYPVVAKADVGQGGHGYRICNDVSELREGYASVREAFPESGVLVEQYLPGRLFDIQGIVHRGEVRPYIVLEQNYFRHMPRFMRCWLLFNPGLDAALESEMRRIVSSAVSACEFLSGPFHVEVRLDASGRAYAIDLSNRLRGEFARSARTTTGCDMIYDYVLSMMGTDIPPPNPEFSRLELRYYTHSFEAGRLRAAEIARRHPALVREEPDGDRNSTMYVFLSESEPELRSLIGDLDEALRHD